MPYPNEHSARVTDPKQYDEFRRQNDKFGTGIHAIFGIKKGPPRKSELQAIRFSVSNFTADEAKKWLKDHKQKYIKFEAASKPKEEKKSGGADMTLDPKSFYRALTVRAQDVDEDKRTIALTFSSEATVMRWYGKEILRHGKDNVDLSQLRSVGAMLINHDPNQIVGPIIEAEIGEDRRGHAKVGFDDDELGNMAFGKVKSKSLRGVSVRYEILKAHEVKRDEEYEDPDLGPIKGPALIATHWKPIEFSLTPVPADAHVGVGRDATRSLDGIEIEQAPEVLEDETMDERTRKFLEARGLDPKADEDDAWKFLEKVQDEDKARIEADAKRAAEEKEAEAKRKAEAEKTAAADGKTAPTDVVREIYDSAVAAGQTDLAFRLASEGKRPDEIRQAMLDELNKQRGSPAGPGQDADAVGAGAKKIEDIDDDQFAHSICDPQMSFAD